MIKTLENRRIFRCSSWMILIVLVCSLFTGCTLLDVKDKGGMINPDAASLEGETSMDGDRTENDISRFMKNKTGSESDRRSAGTVIGRPVTHREQKCRKRFPVAPG